MGFYVNGFLSTAKEKIEKKWRFTTGGPAQARNKRENSQEKRKCSNNCPRRDIDQKAKSREGTLETRAYIKESTYS